MAVVIQEVCGTEEDGYYLPTFSGVARSINYYPVGDETAEAGICNVAMGLGKLVVDGGKTLRFSPAQPQKAMQTSTAELALRETQNEVFALDLHPEAFRISTDDGVNIVRLELPEAAKLRNAQYVTSVWDWQNERISDSPFDSGRKIITFNNILKYNTFPLATIVSDLLQIGAEEMRCPVEMEFAVNMDVPSGEKRIFNLLQIRPIMDNEDNTAVDWSVIDKDKALIYSENALGIGTMNEIRDIVYIRPEKFSSLATEMIAEELLAVNARMRDEGRGYVLAGAGRWGSSDPFLGVPAKWNHISEARVIAECNLPNFRVEPSQGTHFFQNVTSLGIGYMTIDPSRDGGWVNWTRLAELPAIYEGEFLRIVRFDEPLTVCVDGKSGKGVVK